MNCNCINNPNRFCHICGHVLPQRGAEITDCVKIGHSLELDKSHQTMECLSSAFTYHIHKWLICADLKVLERILGLQEGYTKYSYFIFLWDGRDDSQHYVESDWPLRQGLEPGSHNVFFLPLVEPTKILLPPHHTKLGLMKKFVKSLNKEGRSRSCFPS